MIKKIIFRFTYHSSNLSLRISSEISLFFFTSFFIVESWMSNENESFRKIFSLKDKLEFFLKERVIKYVNGIYLKHHLRK